MLSVQTLARRIRTRLHDSECITYEDEEILDCINCGIRFIRRLIASMRPALLMSEETVMVAKGGNRIKLTPPLPLPIKIINVTIVTPDEDEKALEETEMAFAIHKKYTDNEPREFYFAGDSIYLCPATTEDTIFTVRKIDDIEELTWEDNSPLPTEFDDFLVEYATIRLSAGNEYEMTQESQLMANIVAQIQQILIPPPVGIITKGYW